MERIAAVVLCAVIMMANPNASSVAENYEPLILDGGFLYINATGATWGYSADDGADAASDLEEILRGALEDRVYNGEDGEEWPYQVAIFRHNGSILLEGSLKVEFSGRPAVSIESLQGDITIGARLTLDGYLDVFSKTGSLGGFGANRGPGGGGLLEDPTNPKPPGGAGHGGLGGEAFVEIRVEWDPHDGIVHKKTKYGYPYLNGDGYHLLGGSAGGKNESGGLILTNPKGGGALELTAKGKITIAGHISANGQSGIPYDTAFVNMFSAEPCAGGGSGGLIRMRAQEIEIRPTGFLSVTGGNGAQNTDTNIYCGGGGAGGIVEFQIADRVHGYLLGDHLFLEGGQGSSPGWAGTLEVTNFMPRNVSQDGCDRPPGCDCNMSPPSPSNTELPPSLSTSPPDEPASTRPITAPLTCDCSKTVTCPEVTVPVTCDCSDTVTACPTVGDATECDCSSTACPTVPETVTCDCPEVTTDRGVTAVTKVEDTTREDITEVTSKAVTSEKFKVTTEFGVTKPLTPDAAAKILEESLDEIGGKGGNSTQEDAIRLLKATEALGVDLGKRLAESRQDGEMVNVSAATEAIGMQVVVDDVCMFGGVTFPDPTDAVFSSNKWKIPYLSQEVADFLQNETASGYIIVVNILYLDISEILSGKDTSGGTTSTVNSRVIGTTVVLSENASADFTDSVRMTAEKLQKNSSGNTSCVFWDFTAPGTEGGAWSSNGCRVDAENGTHTVCVCDHLTNFAVLLKPGHVVIPPGDEFALGIISYVGLGLSLFSLLLAFITISVSLKSLRNFPSAVIHLNLITALGLADALFLIGADDTQNEMWCTTVAIILHYLYLSTFMWMLCEGFHIYIRVTSVFNDVRGHLKFYFLVAWGIPAVIVGITAGVNLEGYGTARVCWLAASENMLWAFAAPIGLVVAMNVIFLVMILYKFLTVKSIAKKSKYEQLKKATRAAIVLLPLLGTTWIFGLLAFGSGSVALFYVFVILNSLQGVFICIFHCLTNDDVATTLRNKLRRSRTKIDVFFTSTDRRSQPKSKSARTSGSKHTDGGSNTGRNLDGLSTSADGPFSTRWATLPANQETHAGQSVSNQPHNVDNNV